MDERPTHLDLFSGIGGFALAAGWAGFRTIAFCEREEYCQKILAQHWPEVPIEPDIFKLDGTRYRGIDLLTGGFPCQPYSVAGKRRGKKDDRALWPEMLRVIKESKPAWIIGENVAGFVSMELDGLLSDLESQGYSCRPFIVPACAVDARHRRDRVWVVGHSERMRESQPKGREQNQRGRIGNTSQDVAYTKSNPPRGMRGRDEAEQSGPSRNGEIIPNSKCERQQGQGQSEQSINSKAFCQRQAGKPVNDGQPCLWLPEPAVGRVANGIPHRSHRLKGLGNAVLPQIPEVIIKEIRKLI